MHIPDISSYNLNAFDRLFYAIFKDMKNLGF